MCEKPLTADELRVELTGRVKGDKAHRAAADVENMECIRATVRLVEEACM